MLLTKEKIKKIIGPQKNIRVNFFGYKNMYKNNYKTIGLNSKNIIFKDIKQFEIEI